MAEFNRLEDFDCELKLKQISSSIQSQDVSHVLTSLFKNLLSKNSFNTEIIENQVTSKGSDDPYHERYVSELQKLFEEKEKRIAQITNLERYIIQAQAKALSANEKLFNKYWSVGISKDISTPNENPQIYSNIDLKMLKDNGLLTPDDYITEKKVSVVPPKGFSQSNLYSSKPTANIKNQEKTSVHQISLTYSCSDKSVRKPDMKPAPKINDLIFPNADAWKEYPTVEERLKEKHIMLKMVAKANYLRNPRYQPHSLVSGTTSLIHQRKTLTETSISLPEDNKEKLSIFIPTPKEIVFKEYKIGKIYEATLELKNVSSVLRSCRVLPPSSKYFTIGLGQFPGDHGLVAPGMSCIYTIRFAPDSLGDFNDNLKIITQASDSISVSLLGKRPHPILTLPPSINLGYCLVGATQVTQVVIKNIGGVGCFCLLPASTWSTTNFRTVVHEETVSVPPFLIRPSTFEMKNGQVGVLEFLFKPTKEQLYQENITVVCDNCQVKKFEIVGIAQKAEVDIVSSKDVYTEPATEEEPDKHFINFGKVNQFTFLEKNFTVKNCTNVSLPFYWKKYYLPMETKTDENSGSLLKFMAGTPPFCVYPTYGIFPPAESLYFEAVFAPEKVNPYRGVLQMMLENVPNQQRTEENLNLNNNEQGQSTNLETNNENDFVGLSVEFQGECIPFSVMLHPYAMLIHGKICYNVTEKREFSFINNSITAIKFAWESFKSDYYILEVVPSQGIIDPSKEIQLQMFITACRPGSIDHQLECYLEYQDEPIYYNVKAEIKGPDILIEEPNVDFGLICRGKSATREITLCNKSPIPAEFSIQESNCDQTELQIKPENGTLQPLESCKISITYNAQRVLSFTKYISLQVIDGEQSSVLVFGEVQTPNIVLKSCQIYMECLYHQVPAKYYVMLINNTLLPTHFEWQQAFGSQAKFCDIQFVPQSGSIDAKEELYIELTITAYRKVLLHDIYIHCQVAGMEISPCLALSGEVLGVEVKYKVSPESFLAPHQSDETQTVINFGDSVGINSSANMYVHIFNDSAIDTTFNAYIEHFPARLPTPPPPLPPFDEKLKKYNFRRDSIWKKSNGIKLSKTFLTDIDPELMNSYLRDNNGAAFLVTPIDGQLPAYSSAVLQVSAFNNMWGKYSDTLCCKVGDLELTEIPILLNVVGTPLQFLIVGPNTDQSPKLRFGSHVAGNKSTERKLRICNTSPFDIRIDWIGYNVYEDDDKFLDFNVIYGDPFPILEEDGREICPATPESSKESKPLLVNGKEKGKDDVIVDHENFIKTSVDIHNGIESDQPFTIIPKQMLIKAKSDACLFVHLSPPPVEEVTEERSCISFGLGYLNLSNVQDNSSRISRPNGYDIDPLTIQMTAQILPAQLFIDFMGEDKLYFESELGELLVNNKLSENQLKISSLKLINQTQTAMNFILLCKQPFSLVNTQQSSADKTKRDKNSDSFTLYPQKHLVVKVGFALSSDLVKCRQKLEAEDDACQENGISLKTVGKEKWMNFLSALTIQFKNESTQVVTAEADVALPNFEISTEEFDFGICWIGQEKWEEFILRNISQSKTFFFINVEVLCPCCDTSVFEVEPSTGYLDAHVRHSDDYWKKIKIHFAVKKVGRHQAELTINGIMGEKRLGIFLIGYGSYDGRHCSVIEG